MSSRDCNYCVYQAIKRKAERKNQKLVKLRTDGWVSIYISGLQPIKGQGLPKEHNGKPIRFVASFMELPTGCCC